MKVGDLVRIKTEEAGAPLWHQFMGQLGLLVDKFHRVDTYPAAKVVVNGEVVSFDLVELEKVNETSTQ